MTHIISLRGIRYCLLVPSFGGNLILNRESIEIISINNNKSKNCSLKHILLRALALIPFVRVVSLLLYINGMTNMLALNKD